MKAQYHPHFLFNALNTIYFQMDEDTEGAKHSIEKFSELLRYQLYDQQQQVPIMQEIEYLQSFIELQKIRSTDKLKLNVDFDKKLNALVLFNGRASACPHSIVHFRTNDREWIRMNAAKRKNLCARNELGQAVFVFRPEDGWNYIGQKTLPSRIGITRDSPAFVFMYGEIFPLTDHSVSNECGSSSGFIFNAGYRVAHARIDGPTSQPVWQLHQRPRQTWLAKNW